MIIRETKLKGCFVLEPKIFDDNRGCFFESFNQNVFNNLIGREVVFVQDNQSFSTRGVVRALHAQAGAHAQAKLVQVLSGIVLDVAVDARPDSPTFGEHFSIELTAENKKQLFIPRGFLHGFVTLSDTASFFYKCDNYYNKESEAGVRFDDPALGIDWLLERSELIVAEKDRELPYFQHVYRK